MTKRTWIWLAVYVTLVPGIALLTYAEAIRVGGRFSGANRTVEHVVGALLILAFVLGSIVVARPGLTALPLIVWALLTALPGLALLSGESCGSEDFCIRLDYSPYGEILISAWLIGSAVMLLMWALQRDVQPTELDRCPRCGRGVAARSPTCLACGYDFVRGR